MCGSRRRSGCIGRTVADRKGRVAAEATAEAAAKAEAKDRQTAAGAEVPNLAEGDDSEVALLEAEVAKEDGALAAAEAVWTAAEAEAAALEAEAELERKKAELQAMLSEMPAMDRMVLQARFEEMDAAAVTATARAKALESSAIDTEILCDQADAAKGPEDGAAAEAAKDEAERRAGDGDGYVGETETVAGVGPGLAGAAELSVRERCPPRPAAAKVAYSGLNPDAGIFAAVPAGQSQQAGTTTSAEPGQDFAVPGFEVSVLRF